MNPIRVVLVDDHTVVRRGLRSYLDVFADIVIVGEAESGEALLEHVDIWLPDVVVMDLMMPGGMTGIDTTREVKAMTPRSEVVVLTADTRDERVIAALRAGAIGYVRKDSEPELLLAAVRAAARGQSMLDPQVASRVIHDLVGDSLQGLTQREHEILTWLAHGLTNREIAEKLVVSEETVKTHVGNILAKFHMRHRIQAVIVALKQGLLSLDDIDLGDAG